MKTTTIKETHCKTCFHKIDAHTTPNGNSTPKEGDLSICAYCGTISMFDKELNLIHLSYEQIQELKLLDKRSYGLLQVVSCYIKQRIKNN